MKKHVNFHDGFVFQHNITIIFTLTIQNDTISNKTFLIFFIKAQAGVSQQKI